MIYSDIKDAANLIRRATNILILGHVNPDGDSIGSMASLALGLDSIGKNVTVWSDDPIPNKYRFITLEFEKADSSTDFDLAIVLDTSVETRIGAKINLNSYDFPVLAIDHHLSTVNNFDYIYTDTAQAATACIIYDLIKELGINITRPVAEAIYAAIITDTGCFTYSNTNHRTFEIALDLLDAGIDTAGIASVIYNSNSWEQLKILGEALNTLEFVCDGKGAFMLVTAKMIEEKNLTNFDSEDFVNYPRSILSVMISCLITELPGSNLLRLSFRSKTPDIDVSILAKHFGGGGHKCASGAKVSTTLDQFMPEFKKIFKKYITDNTI